MQFRIPEDRAGELLIDFLVQRFPYLPREGWLGRIDRGRVLVNAATTETGCRLARNDVVESLVDDIPEPAVCADLTVIHEDRDILVVDKPPNLPCHPGGRYFNHTLWAVVKREFGIESPAIINRLDRETSGVALIGKTEDATRRCRMQFAERRVEKTYIALVEGAFPESLEARGYLALDEASVIRKKRKFVAADEGGPVPPGGETSVTRFRRVALGAALSEVESHPETGRSHQIRATLQSLGFPVVGDKMYGVDPGMFLRFCTDALTAEDRLRLRMDRQALHAARLCLRHPRTHKPVEFAAPLPADMAGCMARG